MGLLDNLKLAKAGFKPDMIKEINAAGVDSDSIIELSKNGYSPDDVKELIALSSEEKANITAPENNDSAPDETDHNENTGEKDDSDYKKKLDDANAELAKLREQVKMQQRNNARTNLGNETEQTPREIIREAFKNLS